MVLAGGDDVLIRMLTRHVRVVTAAQLARHLWSESGDEEAVVKASGRRLRMLIRAGLVISTHVRAHRELDLHAPVWSWAPGDLEPPFGRLEYRLRTRWVDAPRMTTVYMASARSGRRYAGHGGRLPHPLQATHDIHVSAIFLKLRREKPDEAGGWVSETTLSSLRRGEKLPDAEIQDAFGRTLKVIEFGGAYSADRCRKVHADCVRRNVPYELW